MTPPSKNIPRTDFSDAQPFKLDGVYCLLIQLTQGQYAIVDAADHAWLSRWIWFAIKGRAGFYAVRNVGRLVYMHRVILGLKPGDGILTDHEHSTNTTNNSRGNIRRANPEQNGFNSKNPRSNKTGRKGVNVHSGGLFEVFIRIGKGKRLHLGLFKEFEKAVAVREAAERKYHGEFARVK